MNAELRERINRRQGDSWRFTNAHTNTIRIADGIISDLLAEVERLEEELKTQKRAAWNHEGVSKDYILAMKKVKNQDEQIVALTRQRDILSDYVRERADRCGHCDNCWSRCYINQAKQALAAAGMEEKE